MKATLRTRLRLEAAAGFVSIVAVAYFVWWGCFAAVIPTPNACGNLCCPDCECCARAPDAEDAYCSKPGEQCQFRCDEPGVDQVCYCTASNQAGRCHCREDGTMNPCDMVDP